ncbi:PhoH family protein [uncultured Treponema sp.]|uniref:PhoH family protein n=1 Tax=uncultured Treponema sp. TaxID=162155 RepID=UPI00259415E7|nr:PhoH family protein [uncultured Treponema sp.]
MHRICGTNDSNLSLIENFLGVSVFARGNELSVNSEDKETTENFRFIIDRISDEFSVNESTGTDREIIQSVLNTEVPGKISDISVSIPGAFKRIYPETKGQADLILAMRSSDLVFALGPAGSGKTYLAAAEALRLLLCHKVSSIVITRPVVEAGESLGYLPGDLQEKINPYIKPLYDAMNSILPRETIKKLNDNNLIETAPLAYMRGRTLKNCAVILDEAQNTTPEQMKMFLTRMGENSKVFITGDPTQVDLPPRIQSGLVHSTKILNNIKGISIVELTSTDVVRNPLVKQIIQAYENEERQGF